MVPISENSVMLYDAGGRTWLQFSNPVMIYAVCDLESVVDVLRECERQVAADHLYAAGFLSYEAGPAFDRALVAHPAGAFPLIWLGLYERPTPFSFPSMAEADFTAIPWRPSVTEDEYRHSFQRIKEYIRAGDTYQVNYSFRLQAPFSLNPWTMFVRMIHAQGNGYGAFVNTEDWTVCSASPELFFTLEEGQLLSRPMKGTAARGLTYADDRMQADWLVNSEKNRAENVMIVDMVRNDMGRVSDGASVEVASLYDCEKYPTLWQMTSTVQCQTKESLVDIFRALFPAASITGAPKVRTMQIIADLESTPRRIYTGTIGFLSPERRAQFNVAIRTVLVDNKKHLSEYGVGGAIVWDSEKAEEMKECYTKAKILVQKQPDFSLLETILWTPQEGYVLLDHHLKRLAESAAYFSRPAEIDKIREKLSTLSREFHPQPMRMRLLLQPDGEPVYDVGIPAPLPQPYRIGLADKSILSNDVFLYHKTTNRQCYEERLASSPGYDDLLLWNENREITESCIANVVVDMDGKLLTPPVTCGLLPGTLRSFLLDRGQVGEQVIKIDDLQCCSKVYLVNSLRGIWEVSPDFSVRQGSSKS
ncbi:MAG: aminodeoxychorismate synthase component I [Deltaproteobacteria bacterium]|nr:aminodeoxychorismate synthase component I [Deltaproteobacteria bacterium]